VTNFNGGGGPGADGGTGGNGGNGQGGAVYVAPGGTLTILDSAISGAAVAGGGGGAGGAGQGPASLSGETGTTGGAQGAGIFLSGVMANIGVSTGTLVYGDTIGGTGLVNGATTTAINKTGAGALVLSATNTFTGNVDISGGTLAVASQANLGTGSKSLVMSDGTTFAVTSTATFANTLTYKIAGASSFDIAAGTTSTLMGIISDNGSAGNLVKTDTGTLVLSGANTYTGGTTIDAGTLRLGTANALPSTGTVEVASGATLNLNAFNHTFAGLAGAGTVTGANSTVRGAFAPGNGTPGSSMSIVGNLAFQSSAIYMVQVNPATSSFATVTGTATLTGGNVLAVFAPGSYLTKSFDILHAAGGFGGTTFSGVSGNLPAGFGASLSYTTTDVFLNLTSGLSIGGLNRNQQSVANAINTFFNNGGALPPAFVTLFGLSGASLGNALTQASGELATGSQQTTFDAMNLFLGLLTDPFMNRSGGAGSPPGASGYAEEGDASAYAATRKTDAFAMFTKAPPAPFVQRWSVWTAGFGGSQSTDGNAAAGSNNTTSSVYGTAVGADYLFSPNTVAGFALAGGGTNFSVVNSGSGHSDLFQAGAYVRHTEGPAYISAALAYGWQDITTNRTLMLAGFDQLRAEFNANAFSGRLEGGYRFVSPWVGVGITPYAAAQFTTFDLPAYAEQAIAGTNNFALAYGAKSVTDPRSELGFRTDKSYVMQDGVLTLRGRLAWAHDYDPDRAIGATFQTLPGASFVVNGAAQASDSVLTTASIERKWINNWSIAATFEGEFSNVTNSYAGKGVVRYQW
jgi:autotransporter-associated beta strand protein